jgi:hypothetical protein
MGLIIALALVSVDGSANQLRVEEPVLDLRWPSPWLMSRIILPATLCGALVSAGELFTQAEWPVARGIEPLTWVIAGSILFEAVGSMVAARIASRRLIAILGGAALAVASAWGAAPIAAFWGLNFIDGWIKPLRSARIQREAADHQRAQAASWAGALDTGVSVLILPVAASLQARLAAPLALSLVAGCLAIIWVALSLHGQRPLR